jgi:hypothetical protein
VRIKAPNVWLYYTSWGEITGDREVRAGTDNDVEEFHAIRKSDWRAIRRVFDAAMKAGAEVRGAVASDVARTALARATIKARAHFSKRRTATVDAQR